MTIPYSGSAILWRNQFDHRFDSSLWGKPGPTSLRVVSLLDYRGDLWDFEERVCKRIAAIKKMLACQFVPLVSLNNAVERAVDRFLADQQAMIQAERAKATATKSVRRR